MKVRGQLAEEVLVGPHERLSRRLRRVEAVLRW